MNFAATMAGMSEVAVESAAMLPEKISTDVAEGVGWIQLAVTAPQLTDVTFGRWNEVLAAEPPPATLPVSVMLHHYARGVAHAALGDSEAASASLDSVRTVGAEVQSVPALLDMKPIPVIAEHALAGEIELRSDNAEAAVDHFLAARDIEDEMVYLEPPLWYYPIRWSLGRALLEADRPAEAEQAYRESLLKFRDNGWSLYGLAESLEAQGKTDEAAQARVAFEEAWAEADVEINASRLAGGASAGTTATRTAAARPHGGQLSGESTGRTRTRPSGLLSRKGEPLASSAASSDSARITE